MKPKLSKRASHLLDLLPFAHAVMRTTPAPHLLAAATLVRHPMVRRFAPRLSAIVTVGLAAVAVVSFVKGLRTKPVAPEPGEVAPLTRSSAT